MQPTNINIQAEFIYEGVNYKYTCPYNELDRNYDDEHYAYFLKDIPNTECGLFEINILKDKETELMIKEGYVISCLYMPGHNIWKAFIEEYSC